VPFELVRASIPIDPPHPHQPPSQLVPNQDDEAQRFNVGQSQPDGARSVTLTPRQRARGLYREPGSTSRHSHTRSLPLVSPAANLTIALSPLVSSSVVLVLVVAIAYLYLPQSSDLHLPTTTTATTTTTMASKIAVVTGANQGIGYEIVRLLKPALGAGSRVVLCSRDRTRGQQAVESLRDKGVEADLGILEITDKNSIESFAQWLRDTYGRVDILINNAGFAFKVRECHLGSERDICVLITMSMIERCHRAIRRTSAHVGRHQLLRNAQRHQGRAAADARWLAYHQCLESCRLAQEPLARAPSQVHCARSHRGRHLRGTSCAPRSLAPCSRMLTRAWRRWLQLLEEFISLTKTNQHREAGWVRLAASLFSWHQ